MAAQEQGSVVAVPAGNDSMRGAALAIHLAQVARERLRLLSRGKVAALVVLGLEHELANRMRPPSATQVRMPSRT